MPPQNQNPGPQHVPNESAPEVQPSTSASSTSPPDRSANTPQVIGQQQSSAQPYIGSPDPLPTPKKRRLPKILLLVMVVLVLLGSGGGYAYWRTLNNRPEKVLADALSSTMTDLLDRKPTTFATNVVYTSKGAEAFTVTVDFDAKQASDDYESAGTLRFEGYGVDISVKSVAIVIDGKEAYFKFENLEKTAHDAAVAYPEAKPLVDQAMPFIQKIDGQWIKVDTQSVADAGLTESEHELNACSEAFKNLRISHEDKGKIKEIFSRNQFAIATEKLPKETANGEESFHYKLDLNAEAGATFTKELIELRSFEKFKQDCDIEAQDIDESLKDQKPSDEGPEPVIELWVGSETRLPTRLRVAFDDKEVTITFDSMIKINAPDVNVKAPTDAMPLTELMQDFDDLQVLGDSINKAIE